MSDHTSDRAKSDKEPELRGEGFVAREACSPGKDGKCQLPPVDFSSFLLGLGHMTLVHLGELAEPGRASKQADLEQARHTIDILDMLAQKTQGNLEKQEKELLQSLRSDLKIKYVAAVNR